ncbi:MAG: glycosyltransferase, partial [Muribaculaceae bacterium]|nr:glycosyltransferase [Muribaculaceae bacterium]
GLTALEAMAAGCIPIVSDSLGINEYVKHGKNGIVIKEFNNADSFVKVINDLTNNHALTAALLENATLTAAKYDFDNYISKYSDYFNRPKLKASRPKLTDSDKSIIAAMSSERSKHKSRIAIFNFIQKITPRPAKEQLVKVINKLYNYINK